MKSNVMLGGSGHPSGYTPNKFLQSILRWGRHWHRCNPDVFIFESSWRASKAWECSATLRLTPALAHWESSGTVLCSALVSSQSCFMGGMLGELAGHRKALVIACRCSVQTTLATDGRYGVEVRASACRREAEHLQAFLACRGVITKMNTQACCANGGHTQYWRGTLLFVV